MRDVGVEAHNCLGAVRHQPPVGVLRDVCRGAATVRHPACGAGEAFGDDSAAGAGVADADAWRVELVGPLLQREHAAVVSGRRGR